MKHFEIATTLPTQTINGIAYVTKAKGELAPLSAIKPEHVEEDEMVRRLAARAVEINRLLSEFRTLIFDEVTAYRSVLAEKYGVSRGGKKGNITLTTLDGSLRLTIAIGDTISFGPELEVAKTIIDDCIRRWSDGANKNMQALVDQAFQVDKTGAINTDRILALRRLQIEDETGDWKKAMDVIADAVRVTASKEYARFHTTDPRSDETTRIALDLANA